MNRSYRAAQMSHTWKILRCTETGRMTETAMVRKEPIRDMKNARKGTNLAAAKQPHARSVRTTNLLTPAGTPAHCRHCISVENQQSADLLPPSARLIARWPR